MKILDGRSTKQNGMYGAAFFFGGGPEEQDSFSEDLSPENEAPPALARGFAKGYAIVSSFVFALAIGLFLWQLFLLCSLLNTTFTNDEISLLKSLKNNTPLTILSKPLEENQAAPLLYVWLMEAATSLFGTKLLVGRIFSLLCWVLLTAVLYFVLDMVFRRGFRPFSLLGSVCIASLPLIFRYGWVFKPYMLDCLILFAVIFCYYLYLIQRLSPVGLTAVLCLSLWLSIPACFFVGGVLAVELPRTLTERGSRRFPLTLGVAALVLLSFGLHYYLWLAQHHNKYMDDFWFWHRFPIGSLREIKNLLFHYFGLEFGAFRKLIFYLAAGGIVTTLLQIRRPERTAMTASVTAIALTIIASSIGKYPVSYRLFLFIYPLFCVFALIFFYDISRRLLKMPYGLFAEAALLLACFFALRGSESLYKNDLMERLKGNTLTKALERTESQGEQNDAVHLWLDTDKLDAIDVALLEVPPHVLVSGYAKTPAAYRQMKNQGRLKKCWIIVKSDNGLGVDCMTDTCRCDNVVFGDKEDAAFREVMFKQYNVILYHYVNNLSDLKTKVKYELLDCQILDGFCRATIGIVNTGPAWLNATSEPIVLTVSCSDKRFPIPRNIAPKERANVKISFPCKDNAFAVQLVNEGKFKFEDLGIPPLIIDLN